MCHHCCHNVTISGNIPVSSVASVYTMQIIFSLHENASAAGKREPAFCTLWHYPVFSNLVHCILRHSTPVVNLCWIALLLLCTLLHWSAFHNILLNFETLHCILWLSDGFWDMVQRLLHCYIALHFIYIWTGFWDIALCLLSCYIALYFNFYSILRQCTALCHKIMLYFVMVQGRLSSNIKHKWYPPPPLLRKVHLSLLRRNHCCFSIKPNTPWSLTSPNQTQLEV